ncbi:MAG: acyltransferase [Desulfosarcina sp.]|nr:acyltransferase [Desulfosarcina sp.]
MDTQSYSNKTHNRVYNALSKRWIRFWMRYAGLNNFGRIASLFVSWFAPPHKARVYLAQMNPQGYIEPNATIYHSKLRLGANVFIGEHVIIFENKDGGAVDLGDRVNIFRHSILETAHGGSLILEDEASIHPRCQLNAYVAPIRIGKGTMVAPNCAFYPYDHGIAPDRPIREQPLQSKGGITVGSEAWIGVGVIVLGGVRIGDGAVIAAGSVVTQDIPDGAIAMGRPARVVKMRNDLT